VPFAGVSRILAVILSQQDAELLKPQDYSKSKCPTDRYAPKQGEARALPELCKRGLSVKQPKWLFTETGPKVLAYAPSIQRRKAQ